MRLSFCLAYKIVSESIDCVCLAIVKAMNKLYMASFPRWYCIFLFNIDFMNVLNGKRYMGTVETSSEATRSWSSSPLIISRDSSSHQTWTLFQMGGVQPALCECHYIYVLYNIFITYAVCVYIFITCLIVVAVGLFKMRQTFDLGMAPK